MRTRGPPTRWSTRSQSTRRRPRWLAARWCGRPRYPPAWASPWMRGTFAKFGALTLDRYRRVIVLDSDTIVVKNIDHLSGAPPPLAAYFHFDMGSTCPQRPTQEGRCHLGVLNSGVLALEPDASRLAKARQLLTADDGSSASEEDDCMMDARRRCRRDRVSLAPDMCAHISIATPHT